MSAIPVPPTPLELLSRFWRRLRLMRTAIMLLLLLGAGAAVGSLFPQRPSNPPAVDAWIERHRGWAPVAERVGLFDVYGSWWFMAIYVLLLVSLVGCLVPRYRAFWRAVRSRPKVAESLASQAQYQARDARLVPQEALDRAARALRARRYRLTHAGYTLAAEKGHWREGGSLAFHTAFLLLLVGMSMGKLLGFTGQVAVVEGERFTDTHLEYDSVTEGRFFGERHTGFGIALDDFDVSWYPNGVPRDFVSRVRLFNGDRQVRAQEIRVNHPMLFHGRRAYQLSWGWAPVIRVTQNGTVLYDGPTVFISRSGGWSGVVKVPQTKPHQMGLEMVFFADADVDDQGRPIDRGFAARNPVIAFQQYLGNLRLDHAQSVYRLDPTELSPGKIGALRKGESLTLPDGIEVSFSDLKQYSVFQIAWNPGARVLLLAAVLILVGLIPALYSSRRRVWVRASEGGAGSRVEVAGHALQRRAAFEDEFAALVRQLETDWRVGAPEQRAEVGAPDG